MNYFNLQSNNADYYTFDRKALKRFVKKLLETPEKFRTKDEKLELALCQSILEQNKGVPYTTPFTFD